MVSRTDVADSIRAGRGGAEALDIGCGTGSFARLLALDLSPQMIQVAQERSRPYTNIDFRVANAMTWQYPNERFDCIASIAALHHLPFGETLVNMKRSLCRRESGERPDAGIGGARFAPDDHPFRGTVCADTFFGRVPVRVAQVECAFAGRATVSRAANDREINRCDAPGKRVAPVLT